MTKLKYKPVQTFTVQKNHFFGELYKAAINQYPGKAVIAFGGSTGTMTINRLLAEQFADAGIDVMIIEYHGKEGLPEDLLDQPVEVVGYAAEWLRKAGYKKIYGNLFGSACSCSFSGLDFLRGSCFAHAHGYAGRKEK